MSHAVLLLILALVQDPEVKVRFQFKDAPIEDVIDYVRKVTGTIIKDEAGVSGRITAWSDADIPKSHVLAFLDSALAPNHALVKMGSQVKILRFEEAKRRTLDVRVSAIPEEVPNTEQVLTVIYPLKNLNVVEVDKELGALYPKNATVLINTRSNALIMTGRADEIHKLMTVLSKLDAGARGRPELRVVPLKNADAAEAARIINDLLIKEAGADRSLVAADARTNSIVVSSAKVDLEAIVKLVEQLDEVSSSAKVAIYELRHADAETVARQIGDMFEARESGTGGQVKAVADPRTNTVMVTAARKIHEGIVKPLVEELDRKTSESFKYFRLKNADAADVAAQIRSMFAAPAAPATTPIAASTAPTASSPAQKVYVFADERMNSLMVRAAPLQMEQIEAMVTALDSQQSPDEALIVVRARHTDPVRLQQILSGLSGTTAPQGPPPPSSWSNPFQKPGPSALTNSARSQNPFNTFGRTSTAGGFRPLGPFQDEGGPAPLPQQEPDPLLQEPPAGGVRGLLSAQAIQETGDIIVRTSERNRQRVLSLLEQLDRPRPQVLIKCRIVDVTTDDALALGTEGSLTSGRFVYSTDFAEFNPQRIGEGAFAINSAGIEDLTARLQTLAREGRARILATPSILVLDNEIAEISIGSRVPFIDTVNQTPQGGTQNSIVYQNIGTILRVQPHINPEGRVTMAVNPVISDVDESRSIPITEGVTSPTFTENSATTMVTIRNGTTVVIGGLIREVKDEVVQKIPIIGDIPLIGLAFSRTDTVKSKRELMIFLTPHVVFSEEQLNELSQLEKAGVKLIDKHEMPLEGRRWRSYMKKLGARP